MTDADPSLAGTPAPGQASPSNALLQSAVEAWRERLTAAGVGCRAAGFHSADPSWCLAFAAGEPALQPTWESLRARVSAEQPVALGKVEGSQELLMATPLQLPGGQSGVVGAVLAPPHNERAIQTVLLSLGWLQLALSSASLAHNQRAAQLLELLGHVASQRGARAAAQDWINRTAAWCRGELERSRGAPGDFSLMLFDARKDTPAWWVAADTSYVEKGSPLVHEATEIAARADAESAEVQEGAWWALPLLDRGEVSAVLVARLDTQAAQPLPPELALLLRASADLVEPLLRHWRQADRGLLRHAIEALRELVRKFIGPGHLTWKAGGAMASVALAVLLLVPVDDRVTAHAVIEGRVRRVVTAPFEGFIAAAPARPGTAVRQGETLAQMDDRDLQLEQHKRRSERDQASGKLRQAMAERDAPAVALASAELQQAEAELALVEAKLARAVLRAPLDGIVITGDWAQQIGAPVELGKEMFEIASADGYRVVLHVPDHDIGRVRAGQAGVLRLAAQPQVAYRFLTARVTATASVQEGSNGFRVEAAWDGQAPTLSPGMQGIGKIEAGRTNLLTVWTRSSVDWLLLKLWSFGW